jgi:hypothetical protein
MFLLIKLFSGEVKRRRRPLCDIISLIEVTMSQFELVSEHL